MGAAFEISGGEADAGEQAIGDGNMVGFAMMGGAGQGQLFGGVVEFVIGVAGENGQRLHGFDGRAGEDRSLDVACRGNDRARCVHHHIGATVAINQANLLNEAYLGGGSHYAGSFVIEAKTLETGDGENTDKEHKHTAEAVSGGGAAAVGVAGALAINLLESNTLAHVGERAWLRNGAVSVAAVDRTQSSAKAVPMKQQATNEDVGIGASTAVHVVLGETRAEIGDESLLEITRDDAGLTLAAASDYAVITDAQSGIVGGTAVTAAAAVTVYERNTLARLGYSVYDDAPVYSQVQGDVTVEAVGKETITTTADGGSRSDQAAVGAAIAVALVDSYTEAVVDHHLKSQGNVTIKAQGTGKTITKTVASAKGGKAKDGSTPEDGVDRQVK